MSRTMEAGGTVIAAFKMAVKTGPVVRTGLFSSPTVGYIMPVKNSENCSNFIRCARV
jgi:hypothetical protein